MTSERPAHDGEPERVPVTLRHRAEYWALRAFMAAVRVLGLRGGYAVAPLVARVYEVLDARHVRIARDNLQRYFGADEREARRLAHASYAHFFRSAVEILLLDRTIAREGLDRVLAMDGAEHVDRGIAAGKGVIIATGHLGNWEVIARAATSRGWRITTVYRALGNPLLDDLLRGFRASHGQTLARKQGALKAMLQALRAGEVAILLVDQDARRAGVFVPFLGTPVSTIRTPADLAVRTGATLVTAFSRRTGPGFRHHVQIGPPVDTSSSGDREADAVRIMTEVNRRLETALRQAPEQWLWAHRRWKSAQKREAARALAAGAGAR